MNFQPPKKSNFKSILVSYFAAIALPLIAGIIAGIIVLSAVSKSEYYMPIARILTLLAVLSVVAIVVGAIQSIFASYRRYPIIDRLTFLGSASKANEDPVNIENIIRRVSLQQHTIHMLELRKVEEMRRSILHDLITYSSPNRHLNEKLSIYDISFPYRQFGTLIFDIINPENIFFAADTLDDTEIQSAAFTIIRSVTEEMLGSGLRAYYTTNLSGNIVCILNFQPDGSDHIRQSIENSFEFIRNNYGLKIVCYAGVEANNYFGLSVSYLTAIESIHYHYENSASETFCTNYLFHSVEQDSRIFMRLVHLLANAERSRDILAAKYFAQTISEHIMNGTDKGVLRHRVSCLASLTYELCSAFRLNTEHFTKVEQRILRARTAEELYTSICYALDADTFNSDDYEKPVTTNEDQTTSGATDVGNKIKSYIDEHFRDDMLNVNAVADGLGLAQTYVSHSFRLFSGIPPSDYITIKRQEHAKLLLQSTEKNIKEIAAECGYGHPRTFIRAMKKTEGLTPSEYRKSLKNGLWN